MNASKYRGKALFFQGMAGGISFSDVEAAFLGWYSRKNKDKSYFDFTNDPHIQIQYKKKGR